MVLPKHKIFIEKGSKKCALLAKTEKHHLFDRFFSALNNKKCSKKTNMQNADSHYSTGASAGYAHDDIDDGMDEDHEMIDDVEETQIDAQTQARLDSDVDRLLKGYDWTLAPLANK